MIAEVNQQAPRTFGERTLGGEALDAILYTDRPPLGNPPARIREADVRIAAHMAD
ncbi:hypothetical protein ACHMXJ_35975 [Pseudomonas aeruginosa]|uniref:hypothetical protein n=1 Tax=Pseudomonas aeruginosa TaxID=287 RepID=UPI00379534A3